MLNWFFPKTIEIINSSINGQIKVVKLFGNISLSVDGLTQSGGLLKNIWESGLKQLNNLTMKQCNNVLVLGVGGGTIIQLINKYFSTAKITGIEIDPIMIKLGKKYFGLNEYSNLRIITADAIKWVNNNHSDLPSNRYDLIITDLYKGRDIPKELNSEIFLKNLKDLLNKNGLIIFNRLRNHDNKTEIEDFIFKLRNIYTKVFISKPLVNYLIFCS